MNLEKLEGLITILENTLADLDPDSDQYARVSGQLRVLSDIYLKAVKQDLDGLTAKQNDINIGVQQEIDRSRVKLESERLEIERLKHEANEKRAELERELEAQRLEIERLKQDESMKRDYLDRELEYEKIRLEREKLGQERVIEDKKIGAEIVKVVFDVAKVLLGIGGTLSVGKLLHYIEENGFINLKDWQLMLNILRMGR